MKTSGLVLILMILGGRNCSVFVVNKKKGHTHNICILIKNLLLINAYIIILVCFCDNIYIYNPRGNFHSRTGEPVHSLNEILNVLEF